MFQPALLTLSLSTLALAACSKSEAASEVDSHRPTAAVTEGQRAAAAQPSGPVAITVDGNGFHPSRVEVKKGAAVTLRFTRTSNKTCATEVVFPELHIDKPLALNTPVDIEIPSKDARTLTFQCGMGMYKSQVVIN